MNLQKSQEYHALQNRLKTGWHTYNVYSILSHVHMQDGLAINIAVKEYRSGHYLKETLIGRFPVDAPCHNRQVENVIPGLHAYDGSYTEALVQWEGMEFRVESAVTGEDIVILVTPLVMQMKPAMLVLETGYLWNQNGYVYHEGDVLVAVSNGQKTIIRTSGKPAAKDTNIQAQSPYFACSFTEPILFYTGCERTVESVRELLDNNKKALCKSFEKYGESAPIYEAMQCAIAWNTTYDGRKDRIASPISRLWSIAAGGFILACWDNYFCAFMASLENKDLAYANLIEITREKTEAGFIPNIAHASGYSSEDRSQPPVGSFMTLEVYRRYQEKWIVDLIYPELLKWNAWFYNHRRNKDYGALCWGSDPVTIKRGNYWETEGVNQLFGGALESGMDNSPLYDDIPFDSEKHVMKLMDVGLTGLYLLDCNCMIELAKLLGRGDDIPILEERRMVVKKGLDSLWDEKKGCYCNRRTDTGEFSNHLAPTSFYALFDTDIPEERARRMMDEHYYNPEEFYGEWMIPSIARNDPAYPEQTYWRGRIWPSSNFLAYAAIRGYKKLPDVQKDLAKRSTALMMKEWAEHRHIHENYNADTGEGCDVKNSDKFYHWGALLGLIGMIESGEVSGFMEPLTEI